MARRKDDNRVFSRRTFLRGMQCAPILFLPAPIRWLPLPSIPRDASRDTPADFPFADFRLTPHYPAKAPLDDALARDAPGADEHCTETYVVELRSRHTE